MMSRAEQFSILFFRFSAEEIRTHWRPLVLFSPTYPNFRRGGPYASFPSRLPPRVLAVAATGSRLSGICTLATPRRAVRFFPPLRPRREECVSTAQFAKVGFSERSLWPTQAERNAGCANRAQSLPESHHGGARRP